MARNFSITSNQVCVNGVTINTPSNASISIVNGGVYVNGKKYDGKELEGKEAVNVIIYGNVGDIDCGGNVTIYGDTGDIDCGGNCVVSGACNGDIDAGGNVVTGR